jgi:transcriptional regulator with XRE-family HTH domain
MAEWWWIEWGETVRELRLQQVRTQGWLAEQIGISQSALCRIEMGIQSPTDEVRMKIAEALGKSVTELFPYPENEKTKGGRK